MSAHARPGRRAPELTDRHTERRVLDRFVEGVRGGEGRALVVRGEPGVGKTVLLEYLAGRAAGCRVARAAGVQSEMELAFAGLHQLCAPLLDRAEHLPVPQHEALRTAFGLSAGPAPDRFLVGLAVLSLLSEAAGDRPLICVVDDQQWLDQASAQALGVAARRLAADPVGLVFAARVPGQDVAGLPELAVGGLAEGDARMLLDSVLTGPLDARVREQIIADTHGNPLALLELPRGLTAAQLAGGFGLGSAVPLAGRIEDSFGRQIEALPEPTRRLLHLAAADPSGDAPLVWRAAGRLGIGAEAAEPAAAAELAEFGARARFRHPLVRSAAYRSASLEARRQAHAALAEATDPAVDPDRRAWHLAQATAGSDEEVAAELERSASRAQARGGIAAAAAFLERAALLTPDPHTRARRALAAAQAKHLAGAQDAALALVSAAEAGPSMTCSGPGPTGCGPRSPTPAGAATRPGCCCAPPSGSSRWTCAWPGTPTWTRCGPRTSSAAWPAALWSGRRRRPRCGRRVPPRPPRSRICCSTGWPPRWPTATRRAFRFSGRR